MYLLTKPAHCMLCGKGLLKEEVVISVFLHDVNHFFCETHESKDYNALAIAVLKLRIMQSGNRPLPPITKLEWLILEKAGAILP